MNLASLLLVMLAVIGAPQAAPPAPAPPVVDVPSWPNSSCPIMGKPASSKLFVDTDEGRIYVCCKACLPKVAADAATAAKSAYPKVKAVANKVCPVTGKPIGEGAVKLKLQGIEFALCCPDCVKPARAQAQIVLVKAQQPELDDLQNATCPLTGKATANNLFVVVDRTLVRLSSADCVDLVRKDPRTFLEQAKKLRAPAPDAAPKKSGGGR